MVLLERGFDLFEKGRIVLQEARVEFESFDPKRCGKLNPFEHSHGAMNAQLIHVALRECGKSGLHERVPSALSFTGFRPMTGYCSTSRTAPLMSAASSERK